MLNHSDTGLSMELAAKQLFLSLIQHHFKLNTYFLNYRYDP